MASIGKALLPCPGCGSRKVELNYRATPHVWCLDCGWRSGLRSTRAEAVKAWNKRVAPELVRLAPRQLPPLPDPHMVSCTCCVNFPMFDAYQMREYALSIFGGQ